VLTFSLAPDDDDDEPEFDDEPPAPPLASSGLGRSHPHLLHVSFDRKLSCPQLTQNHSHGAGPETRTPSLSYPESFEIGRRGREAEQPLRVQLERERKFIFPHDGQFHEPSELKLPSADDDEEEEEESVAFVGLL
jgi:hypothetical protein